MPLSEDFAQLFQQDTLSDVEFQLDEGPAIPAHRVVCCARCGVLKAMLTGQFKESGSKSVVVPDVDRGAFLELLRFLYTDKVQLIPENVVKVSNLADKFLLPELHEQCSQMLSNMLLDSTIFCTVLSDATTLNYEPAINHCLRWLQTPEHAMLIAASNPGTLLSEQALRIMLNHWLHVEELSIFLFCIRWADAVSNNRRSALQDVLPLLRLPLIPINELATTVADSGVLSDSEQLALLKHHATNGARPSGFQGEPRARQFRYHHDFDDRGVIYWIGTERKTQVFRNPHESGRVVVTASSPVFTDTTGGELKNVVSRNRLYTRLAGVLRPNSWIAIHLAAIGDNVLRVERYTLRHGNDSRCYYLKSWVFEGSLDGIQWIKLHECIANTSLRGPWASASWDVAHSIGVRHVRVRMTGPCAGDENYMFLGGVELYGVLGALESVSFESSAKRRRKASAEEKATSGVFV